LIFQFFFYLSGTQLSGFLNFILFRHACSTFSFYVEKNVRVLVVGICTKKIVVSYMNLSVLFLSVGSRKKLFYFFVDLFCCHL